jgi:hypothetical protein
MFSPYSSAASLSTTLYTSSSSSKSLASLSRPEFPPFLFCFPFAVLWNYFQRCSRSVANVNINQPDDCVNVCVRVAGSQRN